MNTDRLKLEEARFSSLGPAGVHGAPVVDLFAGSGALPVQRPVQEPGARAPRVATILVRR
jgi:hypothetical protein